MTPENFWMNVNKTDTCWIWTRGKSRGYGMVMWDRMRGAHVVAWLLTHGEWPDAPLDHVCHNNTDCPGGDTCPHRACVNPAHLEPKDQRANLLASPLTLAAKNVVKTHCPKNHPYDGVNSHGARICKTCHREANLAYYYRTKY